MKYHDGQEVKLGDICQAHWCGTCEVIEVDESNEYVKLLNKPTGEIFHGYEEDGSMTNCDLTSRAGE